MERFERVSKLYFERQIKPYWQAFRHDDGDRWASLRLFLWGYANERQGRSPDYSTAACATIDECSKSELDKIIALKVWEEFSEKLKGEKLNEMLNPVCPKGTKYRWKKGGEKTTKKASAVEWAAGLAKPLVAWARDEIVGGRLKNAHAGLSRINGVGPKIASLFLRDLAVFYDLVPTNDRHLLQPIDTWERFFAKEMGGDLKDDRACADYIVEHSGIPERANQGIWYFCTQVAFSSQYLVRRSLKDEAYFSKLVQDHLDRLQVGREAAEAYKTQGVNGPENG